MNIESVGLKGNHEWYEDALVVNPSLQRYGVIDGATSLHPYRGVNGETGAYLAAQLVKAELEANHSSEHDLVKAVLDANLMLREKMQQEHINISDAAALWSCALACVQITEHRVAYVQAGDCMIVAKYVNGTIRVLTHDQVAPIGQQSMALYKQIKEQGVLTHGQIVEEIKPLLASNRYKANTRNGYSVLNGQPELEHFVEHGVVSRNGLEALYIMSDGLFLPSNYYQYEQQQWQKCIELIDELSLSGYAHWLLEEEQDDSACEKHMRLKISDDKTAIKITF